MAFQGEHGPWRPPPALVPSCTHTAQDRCTRRGSTLAGRQSKTCQHTIKSRSSTEAQPQKVHVCQSHVGTHTHTHTHTPKQTSFRVHCHPLHLGWFALPKTNGRCGQSSKLASTFLFCRCWRLCEGGSFFFLLVHFPSKHIHTHARASTRHTHAHTRTHTHTHR